MYYNKYFVLHLCYYCVAFIILHVCPPHSLQRYDEAVANRLTYMPARWCNDNKVELH